MRTTGKSKLKYNGKLVENYQELKKILGDRYSIDTCDIIFTEYKVNPVPVELSMVYITKKYKEFDNSDDAMDEVIKNKYVSNYQILRLKNKKFLFINRSI